MGTVADHTHRFIDHASRVLNENGHHLDLSIDLQENDDPISSVLLLIGQTNNANGCRGGPCLILNKRSRYVKQAGDLCFPGGGIAPFRDPVMARILQLPGMPLSRWPYWPDWRRKDRSRAELMALFFAIGLRESFEEMRLNPLGVHLLGPLPSQRLRMFQRTIYPVAAGYRGRSIFSPTGKWKKSFRCPSTCCSNPGAICAAG
jgi:hypothetical protein